MLWKSSGNAKTKQIDAAIRQDNGTTMTTNEGIPLLTTDDSVKAGETGPSLMQDFHALEKLQHFNRERIPERVVHARGFGVHGTFTCYEDASDITCASIFAKAGKETPTFVRFSTVAGSRGAADTARDVRGFAVKFYTDEGNWDLVGNNIPVFFIQDGIKFPDLIHALKPKPANEVPQASSAQDSFWDFISLTPESAHMIMWLMSDRTLPRSFRMMEGFGVHTFAFIDEKKDIRFVKFHWKSLQGVHSLLEEEAEEIKGRNADFHRADLWEAIELGVYPEWELAVQVFTEEDAAGFDFEYLDGTKLIPEEVIPLRRLGKLTINRNVKNFFAETEQVVFCPANIIRGIGVTNDPMLQSRMMSYKDAGLYRVGTNFQKLPINKPVCPFHNHNRDGAMESEVVVSGANYHPNSLGGGAPAPDTQKGYEHPRYEVYGKINMERAKGFLNHFTQATMFYNSMSEVEKAHISKALSGQLNRVESMDIRKRVLHHIINNIDHALCKTVCKMTGVPAPEEETKNHGLKSAYLSQLSNVVNYMGGRKAVAVVVDGFNSKTWLRLKAILFARSITPILIGASKIVNDADGKCMEADGTLDGNSMCLFDGLLLLDGNLEHVKNMELTGAVRGWTAQAYKHFKPILALGEGSIKTLKACDVTGLVFSTDDKAEVSYGVVTVAQPRVTDSQPLDAFCEALSLHRSWDRPGTSRVPAI